ADGRIAIVENSFGKGRTLLVGTHPGVGYFATSSDAGRQYLADAFAWTGKSQHVSLSNPHLQARVHGTDGRAQTLWVLNPTREAQTAEVTFGSHLGKPGLDGTHWAGDGAAASGASVTVPPRDGLVLRLTS